MNRADAPGPDAWLGADATAAAGVHASWPGLADHLTESFAPALDASAPSAMLVVLVSARIAPITFDDLHRACPGL